ncbi:unnamed protein product [Cyprideis torosa]|uniref:Uncharacterized bromodomain-containing protein 10 helical domain-containing protein n=1 Tax=Cyprideis torosa TaxID=163714 RepID=A0A7R8ZJA6_9CRUS|nr:unnamed protein product [Cyprideis torosa]CAG0888145.1 unnamed protein product [Cyprideis torosa]
MGNKRCSICGEKEHNSRTCSSVEERKIVEWEQTEVMGAENMLQLKHMPEIPMLEHFLQMTKDYLHLKEIPIFTLERSIMLPRESSQFAYLMTCLLSFGHNKDIYKHPPLSYSDWSERLEKRIGEIYEAFFKLKKDRRKMFKQKGVQPKFFDVLGENFRFRARRFPKLHEMNYYQRAWLLLGFCDYLLKTRPSLKKRVFDVAPVSELRAVTLGVDDASCTYYHFPSFAEGKNPAVRVYKIAKWIPPKLDVEYNPRIPKPIHLSTSESEDEISVKLPEWFIRRKKSEAANPKPSSRAKSWVSEFPDLVKATKEEGETLIEGETEKEEEGGERETVKEGEGGERETVKEGEGGERETVKEEEGGERETVKEEGEGETVEDLPLQPLPEVEPDKTFECVADSLDSLRELVKHFESKGSELSYTETALLRKLKALIEELEPSEYKLLKSTRSLRTQLHADFMKFQQKLTTP